MNEKQRLKQSISNLVETQFRLESDKSLLQDALQAMIGASYAYLAANSAWWSKTAGQSMPTSLSDATFEFERVIAFCANQAREIGKDKTG